MKTPRQRKKTQPKNTPTFPDIEEIRRRAHEIFLARGGAQGNELDDWLAAEQELSHKIPTVGKP